MQEYLRSSDEKTRERSDWQSPADWSSSVQTRERTDWQQAYDMAVTVLMAMKKKYLTCEDIYKGIHDDENNVCL